MSGPVRVVVPVAVTLVGVTLAGCGSTPAAARQGATSPVSVTPTASAPATVSRPATPTTSVTRSTPPTRVSATASRDAAPVPAAAPGWTVVSSTGTTVLVDERVVTAPDGSRIVITRFRAGATTLALHAGSEDPPGAGTLPASASSRVSTAERPRLVAAFNGGFKTSAGAGGFEAAGRVLSPLRDGLASVVIDARGAATIGVWGSTVPRAGAQVVAVRQNLDLLVAGGRPSANASTVSAWGATLGGVNRVARSALGQDSAGDLLAAASSAVLPADLAAALVGAGAQVAMELDINPEWVQQDVAAAPGDAMSAALATQSRPADQYETGWTRDFFLVLAG